MSKAIKTEINDDGSVRIWDVYRQQWAEYHYGCERPSDALLASLPADERAEVVEALSPPVCSDCPFLGDCGDCGGCDEFCDCAAF